MKRVIDKTVNLDLVGVNGNAFMIMGVFQRQAKREGWSQDETEPVRFVNSYLSNRNNHEQIDKVLTKAKSKDYNYLLATIENHCEPKDDSHDH